MRFAVYAAAAVVALVVASLAGGGDRLPRVLATAGDLEAFDQDGDYIAWADGSANVASSRCDGVVKERDVRTGRTWSVFRGDDRTCAAVLYEPVNDLALAGTRVLVSVIHIGSTVATFDVFAGSLRGKLRFLGSEQRDRDTGGGPRLSGDGRTLVYALDDEYVHRDDGRRYAGTFGTVALAAGGDAFAVARVDHGGCVCNHVHAVAPDGARALVSRRSGPGGADQGVSQTVVLRTDNGRIEHVLGPDFSYAGWRWSPDGSRVAGTRVGAVVVADLATGAVRRVWRGASSSYPEQVEWSPRGSLLAVVGWPPANTRGPRVVVVQAAGGASRDLGRADFVGWTRDSARIILVSDEQLDVVDVASGGRRTVAQGVAAAGLAPDGTRVAFTRTSGGGLFIVPVAGGPEVRIGTFTGGTWSPDGRHISYFVESARELRVAAADGSSDVSLGRARPGRPGYGRWSRDGSRIAFESASGVEVAVPGEPARTVARSGTLSFDPWSPWSPDGTRLLVEDVDGTSPVARVIDVDAGREASLRDAAPVGWLGADRVLLRLWPQVDTYRTYGELAVASRDLSVPVQLTHTMAAPFWAGVEVRASRTGTIRWRFATREPATAVALDGGRVAVLLGRGKARRIEVRTRQRTLRTLPVAPDVQRFSLAGRWLVYLSAGAIRAVDVTNGQQTVVARPTGRVIDLSIDETRVAWGEKGNRRDTIRALDLPR